jgi:hypothetical protein
MAPIPPPDARRLLELPAFDAEGPARVWVFVPYGTIRPTDLPGPVVGRVLVSYVFYRSPAEVAHWWRALRQAPLDVPDRALVLSMMKPFYLEWAERVRAALTARRFSGGRLRCHFPDETLHTELGEILSHGCTLAVYVGHGRSRGWSGYRGFRWKHVAPYPQQAPVGTMISLSCSSLAQDREHSLPMGLQWVMAGRCGAFLGACDAVEIQPLATITGFMLDILKGDATLDAGDLVRAVDDQVTSSGCAEARRCWSSFRLIGNPFQPLQGAEVVASASKRSSTPVVACRQANSRARS